MADTIVEETTDGKQRAYYSDQRKQWYEIVVLCAIDRPKRNSTLPHARCVGKEKHFDHQSTIGSRYDVLFVGSKKACTCDNFACTVFLIVIKGTVDIPV